MAAHRRPIGSQTVHKSPLTRFITNNFLIMPISKKAKIGKAKVLNTFTLTEKTIVAKLVTITNNQSNISGNFK
ncbi:TPA: hypothetical protein ACHU93_001367, partial [Streptococcus suis]